MSVSSTRNAEMVEALSPDFRRLYSPTHALGDALDMMKSLPLCRAIYPGSANGGRGGGAPSIPDAPADGFLYGRVNNAWASGGTFQSPITIGDGSTATSLTLDGAGSSLRTIEFQTAGSRRWFVNVDGTPESGGNVGSDFQIISFDDSGTPLSIPIRIERSSGNVGIAIIPEVPFHTLGSVRHEFSASYIAFTDSGVGSSRMAARNSSGDLQTIQISAADLIVSIGTGSGVGSTSFRTQDIAGVIRMGFFGTTPVARPNAVTAAAALNSLGLGTSITDGGIPEPANDSILYGRRTVAGVSSWQAVVPAIGGTYTGAVTIGISSGPEQFFTLNQGNSASRTQIHWQRGGLNRWTVSSDEDASGNPFVIRRYNDAGTSLGQAVYIERSTGYVGLGGATPSGAHVINGGVIFNEAGADVDHRFEGNTNVNLLYLDAGNDRVGIGTNVPAVTLHANGTTYIDGESRVRQAGATRYRSSRTMSSQTLTINAFDDTGAVYLPGVLDFSTTIIRSRISTQVLALYNTASETPILAFYDSTGASRQGFVQGLATSLWLASDDGAVVLQPLTSANERMVVTRVTGTTDQARLNWINESSTTAGYIEVDVGGAGMYYVVPITNTGHTFWSHGAVQARFGFGTGQGMTVGPAGGGALGIGRINVSSGIYLNNTLYTNPDYALEYWATGDIVQFAENVGADGYKRLTLDEMESYIRENLQLPRITDEPADIFERADRALEFIEELYTHVIELNHRVRKLEGR